MDKEGIQKSKYRKTNSWRRQPEFDNMLKDVTISGLQYLQSKYEKQVRNYMSTHDINIKENFQELQGIKQRYKMICEEIERRWNDIWASPTYYRYQNIKDGFDSTKGMVYDENGNYGYYMDIVEEEEQVTDGEDTIVRTKTGYILRDLEGARVFEDCEIEDVNDVGEPKLKRKDIYESWDYQENIED